MKCYAVRNGRVKGVFTSWLECEKSVKGYSMAQFKSFKTLKEANLYLGKNILKELKDAQNGSKKASKKIKKKSLEAWVDGSAQVNGNRYSYACVLIESGKIVSKYVGAINNSTQDTGLSLLGELTAAKSAIKYAIKHGYEKINIHYDCEGIKSFAEKPGKTNFTANYYNYINSQLDKISIKFTKVKAHSGVPLNEFVDELADKALRTN